MPIDYNLIAKIKRGKNRKLVFLAIDKPIMPSEILLKVYKKRSNTYFNIVSRALKELTRMGVIIILNKNAKTGRIYKRTKKGGEVLKYI